MYSVGNRSHFPWNKNFQLHYFYRGITSFSSAFLLLPAYADESIDNSLMQTGSIFVMVAMLQKDEFFSSKIFPYLHDDISYKDPLPCVYAVPAAR